MMICSALLILSFLMFNSSPLKISFLVILTSLLTSVEMYKNFYSLFPPSCVVISFSSGMMILFSYCTMMTNYESKKSQKNLKLIMMTTLLCLPFLSINENSILSNQEKLSMNLDSPYLLGMLFVVILSMFCINNSAFSPMKPMKSNF
uniref:NADH dehydrogenase subunit 6 n=1 Tax=Chortoglyphus arcuatus TaxID=66564 RepID=UPI00220D87E9|nr:NADH dehydrogenase subunit 6 [Chortoglyphus arcuatus]UBQ34122.1 NADH dehydrogenase subunit 6 [Chortoglyphus arcuatus]